MEKSRRRISYSVIRYSPDDLKGEIINVGLLLHDYLDQKVKFFMLDEKSSKLRAILEDKNEVILYKTNRDILEFYLEKSKDDMSGVVGDFHITSYYDEDFLMKMYEFYQNKKIRFSKPNVAYTKDEKMLFDTILKRYVGEKNVILEKTTTMTAKKYMKKIFTDNENLNKRIKSDYVIKPIKELDDLEVKIDFTFKNGVWNYMQTIPKITNTNKNTEWFSKTQLILESDSKIDSKVHLIYKNSDLIEDESTYHLIRYIKSKYTNVDVHDIDKQEDINNLCSYIENEGEILQDVI
ncbi:MAG: DUF3037 domain-containing protein [Clostridium sp.]